MNKDSYLQLKETSKQVLKKIKDRDQALTITINNFKGGVGKSTLIDLFAYILVKNEVKTLLIDSDPQRTLTKKILKNFDIKQKAKLTFMEGIKKENLSDSVSILDPYLSIVEGDWEISKLERYTRSNMKMESEYYLYAYLIEELKNEYDLIIFDTVPTTSVFSHNCIVASDYILAPTQAEEESYDNSISYMNYILSMREYNPSIDILGIVPYLSEPDNSTNVKYLGRYKETFGSLTFDHIIKRSARVMTWGTNGITENKGYDKQTLRMYVDVFEEFLDRVEVAENNKEN